MRKTIRDYINSRYSIMSKFGCREDFPIKPMTNKKWAVSGEDGIYFLSIWDEKGEKTDFAAAKKDGRPVIYKNRDYSMVIAIDCVKMAFILTNSNNLHKTDY